MDFKRDWYDLKIPQGINEFLKDTTSIVNTFGPDGLLIIGFDDERKEFKSAGFKDSGLRDTSAITGLINRKVDRLFDLNIIDAEVDGNLLSLIHIPASIDKPHVIRLYQTFHSDGKVKKKEEHKIFVRKGSRVFPASKYDIELMYYDRKNIIPDYEIHVNYNVATTTFNVDHNRRVMLTSYFTIENTGRRPVAISQANLKVTFTGEGESEVLEFASDRRYLSSNIVVPSGEIYNGRIEFLSLKEVPEHLRGKKQAFYNSFKSTMEHPPLEVILANGKRIPAPLLRIQ